MVSRVRVGHFLQAVLAWLVLVPVLLVLGIIPITIFGLYRFTVVEILRKIFRRDLGEPLTLWDFALAADQFCGKSRGAISGIIIVEGELTSQTVQLRFEKIFSSSKFLRNYKRLTSVYPTHWLGYPFWAEIKTSLDISKHLKVVPVSDEDNFEEAREDWLVSPFASKQPLWDILHVPGNLTLVIEISLEHVNLSGFLCSLSSLSYFMGALSLCPSYNPVSFTTVI